MDKQAFFDKLHQELADKFNTVPSIIHLIRESILGEKLSLEQTIDRIIALRDKHKQKHKALFEETLAFLEKHKNALAEIIIKTEFDK